LNDLYFFIHNHMQSPLVGYEGNEGQYGMRAKDKALNSLTRGLEVVH
jgi:hypothetical protein